MDLQHASGHFHGRFDLRRNDLAGAGEEQRFDVRRVAGSNEHARGGCNGTERHDGALRRAGIVDHDDQFSGLGNGEMFEHLGARDVTEDGGFSALDRIPDIVRVEIKDDVLNAPLGERPGQGAPGQAVAGDDDMASQ